MIFAMVGTHEQQFDRLMRAIGELRVDEPRVVQYGYSDYIPPGVEAERFMGFERVRKLMCDADVVIAHAGTGCVMLALSLGKFPVVAPRYRRHGEHVDDHQLQLVESLQADGLIVPWLDGDSLADRVAQARARGSSGRRIEPDARLLAELRQEVSKASRPEVRPQRPPRLDPRREP